MFNVVLRLAIYDTYDEPVGCVFGSYETLEDAFSFIEIINNHKMSEIEFLIVPVKGD